MLSQIRIQYARRLLIDDTVGCEVRELLERGHQPRGRRSKGRGNLFVLEKFSNFSAGRIVSREVLGIFQE
jgi:hypothetical protein